jgi:hypothetical protein
MLDTLPQSNIFSSTNIVNAEGADLFSQSEAKHIGAHFYVIQVVIVVLTAKLLLGAVFFTHRFYQGWKEGKASGRIDDKTNEATSMDRESGGTAWSACSDIEHPMSIATVLKENWSLERVW